MRKQIRFGVFETNSSSTHAVAILTDDEYDQYRKGELLISRYGKIVSKAEIEKEAKEYAEKKALDYDKLDNYIKSCYTREEWYECNFDDQMWYYNTDEMEIEHDSRVIDGVVVHALSIYGYDG